MRPLCVWQMPVLAFFCLFLSEFLSGPSPLHAASFLSPERAFSADRSSGGEGSGTAARVGNLVYHDVCLERAGRPGLPDILMRYPSFGLPAVDSDIFLWVSHIAATFERDFAGGDLLGPMDDGAVDSAPTWLNASYTVSSPSSAAVSIVFDVWMRTGPSHLGEDILTLSYNLRTGQRLHLVDIFENVGRALEILSERSRIALARGIGRGQIDYAIHAGTLPVVENFASLALTPKGIRVYFQPYQVSLLAGSQEVDIPLEALLPAGPFLELWAQEPTPGN